MKQFTYSFYNPWFLLIALNACLFVSCKKFVAIPKPVEQLPAESVFNNDNATLQAITGIYSEMMNNPQQFSNGQVTLLAGMCADELYSYTPGFTDEFINNEISQNNHGNLESYFWNPCYRYIYAANKIIEGTAKSNSLSPLVKKMATGESKFIRAFCYFYLVNLFGDVPLILESEYQNNQSLPRISKATIYSQIINDLKDAKDLVLSNYPAQERTRPNKMAVSSLLARVYLTMQDWINAETEASFVINSGFYALNNNLNDVFLKNSGETIWQLKPVNPSRNTWEGYSIIPPSPSSAPTYLVTNNLLNSFELNDQRKTNWLKAHVFASQTFYYPYKYKIISGSTVTEYYIILRLAEQYLIRAEARIYQNNISGAQSDINLIRTRAGLSNTTSNDKPSILSAIEQERRIELFSEWGHRWFDLKRTGRATAVLSLLKPATWQPTDELWPIPQSQINLNSFLVQNPGY